VWHEEDSYALLVGDKNSLWERTPLSDHSKSLTKRIGKFSLLEDGTLEGDVRVELNGHPAISYRLENYDESAGKLEENLKDEIKRSLSTAEISEIKIENLSDSSKPVIHQYKVRVPSYAQKTGKRLFIQPGFFEYGSEPLFSSSTRKYDIFFRYPWSENDTVDIKLPAGYDLDSAESPGVTADPSKIGSLDIRMGFDKASNALVYERKFHFGGGGTVVFPVGSYTPLKNLFDMFQKSEAHTITLKQK
jgi:hypothetical protein